MEMMRKRFGGNGPRSFRPEPLADLDATNEENGAAADLEQQPRRPLIVMGDAAPMRDEDTVSDGLSGPLTEGERATLDDPRASADQQRMRGSFDRMSNVFLNAGGLAPLSPQKDPYVSERDGMRDWVMKRAAVARSAGQGALSADRTGAYLAATKAGQERQAGAQALAFEREGRMSDAEKARAEAARLKAERETLEHERDQRNKDRDFALKEKAEAKKRDKSKAGPAGAPKGFPAGWELEGTTKPTPKQGQDFEELVFSAEKMRGMTGPMRDLLKQAGATGRAMPGPMKSRLQQLATEIMIEGKEVAKLGALSGPDMGLMKSIAADPTEAASMVKDMPGLLDGLEQWADNSVSAKAKSLGARRAGAGAGVASKAGSVTVRRKSDGKTKVGTPEQAQRWLADPGFERVQ